MCPLSAVSDVPRPVTDTAGFARIDPHCFRGRIVAIPRKFSTTAHVKRHNDKLCRLTRRFPGQEELYGFRVGGMEAGGAEGKRQGVERAGNKYRRMVRDDRRGGAAQVRSRQHPTRDLFRRWTWSISTSRAACNVATVPIIELGIGARVGPAKGCLQSGQAWRLLRGGRHSIRRPRGRHRAGSAAFIPRAAFCPARPLEKWAVSRGNVRGSRRGSAYHQRATGDAT